jgi:Zn-dependent oligopeptidase
MTQDETQMTQQQHASHVASVLQQAKQECRADLQRVSDPKAQALFETTAEVIDGLGKALCDCQQGSEAIWRS